MVLFGSQPETLSKTEELKQKIQQQTAQELAVADVTELINNMTKNCFELCFQNPGENVSPAENKCTQDCVAKYMASWNILSQVYVSRLQS